MGLIDSNIQQSMPFASKCATWSDIQASHNTNNAVQLKLEDFYGILGILGIGLVAGGVMIILETLLYAAGIGQWKMSKKEMDPIRQQ